MILRRGHNKEGRFVAQVEVLFWLDVITTTNSLKKSFPQNKCTTPDNICKKKKTEYTNGGRVNFDIIFNNAFQGICDVCWEAQHERWVSVTLFGVGTCLHFTHTVAQPQSYRYDARRQGYELYVGYVCVWHICTTNPTNTPTGSPSVASS